MSEKRLFIFLFLLSLVGLLALYLLSINLEYTEEFKPNEMIKTGGEVISVFSSENLTIIEIKEARITKVVLFENLTLYEGEEIEIIGKIEEYNGEKEIIAQRIRVINYLK